jgi:hypothetical protein
MTTPLNILSLGAGVQSSTVLLMSCKGIIPKLDAAIFADTQWEPKEVYAHLGWLSVEAARAGIPIYTVTKGNLRQHTLEGFVRGSKLKGQRRVSLPLYVLSPSGDKGIIRRQCTREYKVEPIERFVRRTILGLKPHQRAPMGSMRQWFGISADETKRVRISTEGWKTHIYPLCGLPEPMLDRPYSRHACEIWLKENYPDHPVPRSACVACPFHNDKEWRKIMADPEQRADAVEVDETIRHADGMKGTVYLHRSCKPLKDVDLRTDEDKGQNNLFRDNECLGMCGV